jgi:uncharacterized membrane protein YgcG
MSVGAITSFGSVILNGIEYQTTNTTISIDGKVASQADLHVGDFIEVHGHHDPNANQDIADQIEFRGNVAGPVSAIDTANETLVVLGQTIVVSAETSFDDSISPAGLAGIKVGAVLEISGMRAPDGTIHATRIEPAAAGAGLQVIGTASATDTAAKTLKINSLTVDFAAATLVDFPATGPKDGDLVEAIGATVEASGALKATSLELRTGKGVQPVANDNLRLEGLITRFASPSDFDVAGLHVTTTSNTVFDGGSATDLALNVSVEIEGSVNSAGVIVAAKVQIRRPADVRIMAQVDAVDTKAGTLKLLGVQFSVNYMTRFEDHGDQRIYTFKLSDIHVGDWLEVRGTAAAAGSGGMVMATRIDRRQHQSTVELLGPVTAVARPDFTVLSVNVATTYQTQFNHGLKADTFFNASLVGKIARVEGYWDGTTLTATDVNLGDDDDGGDDHGGGGNDGGGGDGGGNSGPGNGGGGGGGGGPGPG